MHISAIYFVHSGYLTYPSTSTKNNLLSRLQIVPVALERIFASPVKLSWFDLGPYSIPHFSDLKIKMVSFWCVLNYIFRVSSFKGIYLKIVYLQIP